MREITIGQYFPGKSFFYRLDPRAKIMLTIVYIVMIFLCRSFLALGLTAAFTFFYAAASGVPFKLFVKSLRMIVIIVLFTAALNVFYIKGDGEPLVSFWRIEIYLKGIYTAIFIAVRIVCLIIISSLLTYTTTPTMITDAIERLLAPLKVVKVPVHSLAMMMTLALRFIPTLAEEIDRIMNAQKARGADIESGGFVARAKALVPIFVPLFVSAFRRAYELALAMECRCYRGDTGRTRMKRMKFGIRDLAAALITACELAGIILLNIFFEAVM